MVADISVGYHTISVTDAVTDKWPIFDQSEG